MIFVTSGVFGLKFECKNCGTIWIATENSYDQPYKSRKEDMHCDCPQCGAYCWANILVDRVSLTINGEPIQKIYK